MPPVLVNEDEWPAQLKFLVREYGPQKVWTAGLRSRNGFPPTWITTTSEAEAVLNELERTVSAA